MSLWQAVTNHWQLSRMGARENHPQATYGISRYLGKRKDYSGVQRSRVTGPGGAQGYLPCLLMLKDQRKSIGQQWSTANVFNYSLQSGKSPTQNISMSIPTLGLKSQAYGSELARKMNCEFTGGSKAKPPPEAINQACQGPGHRFAQGSCGFLQVFRVGHIKRGSPYRVLPPPVFQLSEQGLEGK